MSTERHVEGIRYLEGERCLLDGVRQDKGPGSFGIAITRERKRQRVFFLDVSSRGRKFRRRGARALTSRVRVAAIAAQVIYNVQSTAVFR